MQYMKKYIKNIVPATFMMLALGATSCIGDLDVDPIDPNIDTNVDFKRIVQQVLRQYGISRNVVLTVTVILTGLDGWYDRLYPPIVQFQRTDH